MGWEMGDGKKPVMSGRKKLILFAALGALGVLLVVIGALGGKNETNAAKNAENDFDDAYIAYLENKICNIVEKVTGDAGAAVIVTCDGGQERVYLSSDGEYVTARSGGETSPVLSRNLYPMITGVSVACRGGGDSVTRKKLIDVVSTALGIPSNRICIVGTK